jgi:hypothetical protein
MFKLIIRPWLPSFKIERKSSFADVAKILKCKNGEALFDHSR